MRILFSLAAAVLLPAAVTAACAKTPAPDSGAAAGTSASGAADGGQAKVLARVNGVPITSLDVQLRLRAGSGHGASSVQGATPAVIETLVREELVRQRAAELGLDRDPSYQLKREEMQAQFSAFERRELGELFYVKELGSAANVSDEELHQYFDQNAKLIRTELHVLQILFKKDDATARAALDEIRGGTPFEDVAKRPFPPQAVETGKPWDLGWMKWNQMPEPWLSVVFDLKPGEVSDVIKGGERYWIIKVEERRENGNLSFEEAKLRIKDALIRKRSEERRASLLKELHDKAKVVYVDPSLAPAPSASAP